MNWKNAAKDNLPKDGEEVLISVDGVNFVAVFKKTEMAFKLKHKDAQLAINENLIYWASIARVKS